MADSDWGFTLISLGGSRPLATITAWRRSPRPEQLVGGRSLQLSLSEDGVTLAQPRLVTDGDIKGGHYVSDIVDIYVGTGPAH